MSYPEHKIRTDLHQHRMKVRSVLGVCCVGKTSYCDELILQYISQGKSRPILVKMGSFLRTALGENFFVQFPEAGSPEITDDIVKSSITHLMKIGDKFKKDVILDGFPRCERQVNWLLNSSHAQTISADFEFTFLHCSESVLKERTLQRIIGPNIEGEKALIERRREYEVYQIIELQKILSVAKKRLKSKVTITHLEV